MSEIAKEPPSGAANREIVAEDIHKSFNHNYVLRGVDLEIRSGEIVAIVGGSGAGKTVLLECLYGHYLPDRGRVLIADHDRPDRRLLDLATLDGDQMDRIRVHWAVVFQQNALFTGTVYDNIALWLREVKRLNERAIAKIAEAVVAAVDLEPDVLDQDRAELSGGMAKRVAVARALAMDPVIMFYDEPTTGLDPHHAAQIHALIRSTHDRIPASGERRTTVIVTHDKDLLHRLRPRIVMLHEGRVYFDGTYDAFRANDSPIIRPYFDLMPELHRRSGDRDH